MNKNFSLYAIITILSLVCSTTAAAADCNSGSAATPLTATDETGILPSSRQLVDGTNTTVNLGTAGQVSVDVSIPSGIVQTGINNTFTGTHTQDISASTQTLRIPAKSAPGSPLTSEIWINGGLLQFRDNAGTPVTHSVPTMDASGVNSNITSLTGLSTPLSSGQGGTGISTTLPNFAFLSPAGQASSAPGTSNNTFTGDFTVSVAIKPTAYPAAGYYKYIVYKGINDDGSNRNYAIIFSSNGIVSFGLEDSSGGSHFTATAAAVPLNQWTKITGTFVQSTGTVKVYVNDALSNTLVAGSFTPFSNSAHPLLVAAQNFAGFYQGAVDDLRIYNVALSSTQIAADYDHPLSSLPSALMAYYQFDEGSGTSASDAAKGNTMTLWSSSWTGGSFGAPGSLVLVDANGDGYTSPSTLATAVALIVRGNLGAAAAGANSDITALSGITTPIPAKSLAVPDFAFGMVPAIPAVSQPLSTSSRAPGALNFAPGYYFYTMGHLGFDGKLIWTTNAFDSNVNAFDVFTGAHVYSWNKATSGGGGFTASVDNGQTIWISVNGTITQYRATDGTVLASITPGGGETAVTDPAFDGTYLWFGGATTSVLYKVNPATGTIVDTISMPGPPSKACFDGVNLWVPCTSNNTVKVIDPVGNSIIASVSVTDAEYAEFDGVSVWISQYSQNSVTKIDRASQSVIASVSVGSHPYAMATNGAYLYVANVSDQTMSVINTRTNEVINTFATIGAGVGMVFDGVFIDYVPNSYIAGGQVINRFIADQQQTIPDPVPITHGGTGGITASAARSDLGAAASGANGDITSLSALSTPLSVAQGGSGAATFAAHKFFGNNTGTTAAPSASSIGISDVSGAAASGANSDITSLSALTAVTVAGTVTLSTAGNGISVKSGSNATIGTGTLSSGSTTISTTAVTSNSLIFLTEKSGSAHPGSLNYSPSTGSGFTVTSSDALDDSTFSWWIIEAP